MTDPAPNAARPAAWRRWLIHDDPSGPAAARLIHMALGAVSLMAWMSLWSEARLLLGWKGLTPVQMTLLQARGSDVYLRWMDFPSHLFWNDTDASVIGGCIAGVVLSILALLGVLPRVMFALNAVLYLGYCIAAQTYLGFQWDNMLVESCVIAAFLSRSHRSPAAHWMGRALIFKVLFESGIAKIRSSKGDWLDGTAMHHYYETAPLPTPLAWYAHNLPGAWHTFETWWTLVLELVLVWGVFCGRVPRWIAGVAIGAFILVDFTTANYGFFLPLSATWCILLLPERTCRAVLDRLHRLIRRPLIPAHPDTSGRHRAVIGAALVWTAWSLYMATVPIGQIQVDRDRYDALRKWRVANAYHLFSSVTTQRDEVEFQTSPDGDNWRALTMRYKVGPVDRAPPFVAPHQPRVDFRLWFYGLNWRSYTPPYVANLLRRICWDPEIAQPLFSTQLPTDTKQVRMVYWRYRFTDPATRRATGDWWTREKVGASRTISCDQLGW